VERLNAPVVEPLIRLAMLRSPLVYAGAWHQIGWESMKVDKAQFEAVVANLLKTPPLPRSEAKTGQPKVGKIIAPKR